MPLIGCGCSGHASGIMTSRCVPLRVTPPVLTAFSHASWLVKVVRVIARNRDPLDTSTIQSRKNESGSTMVCTQLYIQAFHLRNVR